MVPPHSRFYSRFAPRFTPDSGYNSIALHHTRMAGFSRIGNTFVILYHSPSHSVSSPSFALLRAVNPVQPDALALAVVQDGDGVAIGDAHDAASEVGGEAGSGKQCIDEEQWQGGNELRTAHGISVTGMTGPILRESGRKGESGGGPGSESGGLKQELYAC